MISILQLNIFFTSFFVLHYLIIEISFRKQFEICYDVSLSKLCFITFEKLIN